MKLKKNRKKNYIYIYKGKKQEYITAQNISVSCYRIHKCPWYRQNGECRLNSIVGTIYN